MAAELTRCSGERSGATIRPPPSKTCLNRSAPSPTADQSGPPTSSRTRRGPDGGRRRSPPGRPRTRRRRPPPAGVDHREHTAVPHRRRRRAPGACRRRRAGRPSRAASPRAVAIPIRRPVNVPGPRPTRDQLEVVPAEAGLVEEAGGEREEAGRVARARAGLDVVARLGTVAVREVKTDDGRGGRRVEGEGDQPETSIRRRSPPRCSSVTRIGGRPSDGRSGVGHSMKATRSAPR